MRRALLLLLALALPGACTLRSDVATNRLDESAPELETAAIAAGVIPDPANTDLSGLYARDTDRLCVVPSRNGFAIGIFVDYGDQQLCSATGTVRKSGESLSVVLARAPGCAFDARFEGDRIVLPGALPQECASLCSGRASMAALDVRQLSDSVSEARTMRDAKGRLLCNGDE